MAKTIRVTVTQVYTYTPDLDSAAYAEEGITTLEEAFALDRRDWESNKISMTELAYDGPRETALWEIVEDGT